MKEYLQLLRLNPNYGRLWLAQVISLLGDWFGTIVLSALVASYSNNSGLAVSGFLLARFVPPFIMTPLAGMWIDRFDRKRLLIMSDLARTVIVLLLLPAIAAGPQALWLIYLLTMLQFAFSAIFEPGRNAMLPSLLKRDELVIANTLGSVTWSVMLALGAITGGLVAAMFGTNIALLIDALSFVVSAALIMQITQGTPEGTPDEPVEHSSDRSFREGLRFLRRRPEISFTLLVKLGQSVGNVDALVIIYATELFNQGDNSTTPLSIMYAAFGLGAILGPLLLNRINNGSTPMMRRLIIVGYTWIVIGWFIFGSASTLLMVSLALVIRAMGGSVGWTYSSVIIQKSTPNSYLGRMFSLDMAGFQFASVVSTIATGALVDFVGSENVRQVVLIMGVISIAPLILWTAATAYMERREATLVAVGD